MKKPFSCTHCGKDFADERFGDDKKFLNRHPKKVKHDHDKSEATGHYEQQFTAQ